MEVVTRKGHSLKSIPGGLKYFLCLGDQACAITPAALGFHLIKTLAMCTTRCKNFKSTPGLWFHLVPQALTRLRGGQLGCFYDQEVQNANNTTAAESRPESSISDCSSTCQSCHWCQPSGSRSDSFATQPHAHPGRSLSTCRGGVHIFGLNP